MITDQPQLLSNLFEQFGPPNQVLNFRDRSLRIIFTVLERHKFDMHCQYSPQTKGFCPIIRMTIYNQFFLNQLLS